jgi:hypothetical protein
MRLSSFSEWAMLSTADKVFRLTPSTLNDALRSASDYWSALAHHPSSVKSGRI